MSDMRMRIAEVIVVEGIHDKQIVDAAVDADVVVLGGDRITHQTVNALKRAAAVRGVIVLTDPDGAGERIRRRIDAQVPGCKHAYVQKAKAVSSQGVGIEHARPQDVLDALKTARATQGKEAAPTFTMADMMDAGLVGTPDAAQRRTTLGAHLNIGYGNAKAMLNKLNALGVARDEWQAALRALNAKAQFEADGSAASRED